MVENNSESSPDFDIVLFDGVCNLCNHAVNFIIVRDQHKRFKFASLQSQSGIELLKKHHISTRSIDSLVLIRKNKAFIKSTAALKIARDLDGLWSTLYIFILIPAPIRDRIYELVAHYRYKIFGKSESCRYPSDELKTRFLEY
ncbi:thiol-disulfide oxidoreductase DCC family protein [Catalinimonas sp. 4WD22]|uniref:thiol-disulfide oxidoreductase DCC family protein n=1 Tax=Catalinimonas locisalis TaxID=3133978 RepID=UPI003100F1BF